MLSNNLQRTLYNQREFKTNEYRQTGWKLVSERQMGLFIATTIVFIFMSVVGSFIPILGQVYSFIVSPIIGLGYFYMAHRTYKKEELEFGNFFDGFQDFLPNIATIMFKTVIYIAFAMPVGYFLLQAMGGLEFLDITDQKEQSQYIISHFDKTKFYLALLTALPLFFVNFIYQYASLFTIFYKLTGWDALEASRQFVMKHFGQILLLNIVMGLIAIFGMMASCGIGLIVIIPFISAVQYAAFADFTALHETYENDIIDHFIA